MRRAFGGLPACVSWGGVAGGGFVAGFCACFGGVVGFTPGAVCGFAGVCTAAVVAAAVSVFDLPPPMTNMLAPRPSTARFSQPG